MISNEAACIHRRGGGYRPVPGQRLCGVPGWSMAAGCSGGARICRPEWTYGAVPARSPVSWRGPAGRVVRRAVDQPVRGVVWVDRGLRTGTFRESVL